MGSSERPTLIPPTEVILLAVACSPELLAECRRIVDLLDARLVVGDLLASLPEMAARLRPRVILTPEDVYAFDPEEFTALARDVGAELMIVKEHEEPASLQDRLVALLFDGGEGG